MTATAPCLLVDFGASRVKAAIWSPAQGRFSASRECPAPSPQFGSHGEVTIRAESYWQALEATAGRLLAEYSDVDAIWLCAEMHGAMLGEGKPYISWRDGRATQGSAGVPSTFASLQSADSEFFSRTGMRLRAGLPFLTLAHERRAGRLAPSFRFYTLVDWLLWRGGERDPAIHASLAAGTGLYDIHTGAWSPILLTLAGLDGCQIAFPRIVEAGQPLGRMRLCDRELTAYGGLGDMQAAIYGAGFPEAAPIIVNLGTGSQVVAAIDPAPVGIELRPAVTGGCHYSAITHIPSGRALEVFANFLDGCAASGGGQPFFWQHFASLDANKVLAAPPNVDLNVFRAAWRFREGGAISGIHEEAFDPESFIASLAHSWLAQYADAMQCIDPAHSQPDFLLTGGLARRGSFILPVLEALCQRRGQLGAPGSGEETLDGLLAVAHSNRGKQ